jgi:hypothetical protein
MSFLASTDRFIETIMRKTDTIKDAYEQLLDRKIRHSQSMDRAKLLGIIKEQRHLLESTNGCISRFIGKQDSVLTTFRKRYPTYRENYQFLADIYTFCAKALEDIDILLPILNNQHSALWNNDLEAYKRAWAKELATYDNYQLQYNIRHARASIKTRQLSFPVKTAAAILITIASTIATFGTVFKTPDSVTAEDIQGPPSLEAEKEPGTGTQRDPTPKQLLTQEKATAPLTPTTQPAATQPDDAATRLKISFGSDAKERKKYVHYLAKHAADLDTNPVIVAIIESNIRQHQGGNLVSSGDGAVGIMQLTPYAIRDLNQSVGGKKNLLHAKDKDGKNIYRDGKPVLIGVLEGTYSWEKAKKDSYYNMDVGIAFLKFLEARFPSSRYAVDVREELIIASYNCGYPQVRNAIAQAIAEKKSNPYSIETFGAYLARPKETIPYVQKYRHYKTAFGTTEISL